MATGYLYIGYNGEWKPPAKQYVGRNGVWELRQQSFVGVDSEWIEINLASEVIPTPDTPIISYTQEEDNTFYFIGIAKYWDTYDYVVFDATTNEELGVLDTYSYEGDYYFEYEVDTLSSESYQFYVCLRDRNSGGLSARSNVVGYTPFVPMYCPTQLEWEYPVGDSRNGELGFGTVLYPASEGSWWNGFPVEPDTAGWTNILFKWDRYNPEVNVGFPATAIPDVVDYIAILVDRCGGRTLYNVKGDTLTEDNMVVMAISNDDVNKSYSLSQYEDGMWKTEDGTYLSSSWVMPNGELCVSIKVPNEILNAPVVDSGTLDTYFLTVTGVAPYPNGSYTRVDVSTGEEYASGWVDNGMFYVELYRDSTAAKEIALYVFDRDTGDRSPLSATIHVPAQDDDDGWWING